MSGTINIDTVVPPGFILLLSIAAIDSCIHSRFARQKSKRSQNDDNGITGPDWGHSEVVFNCFRKRCFQHTIAFALVASLSVTFHNLLVSSTCFHIFIDCSSKLPICKVLFIYRSSVCISYRYHMGMDHYVQPSYQLQQYQTSSALSIMLS